MKQLLRTPDGVGGDPEHDRHHKTTQTADQADDAADHAHLGRIVVGQAAIDAGLAEALGHADHERQDGEQHDRRCRD
jgi:hypothetical protein